jgi:hypothetical protein
MSLEPAVMYTGSIFALAYYPCGRTLGLLIGYPGSPSPTNGSDSLGISEEYPREPEKSDDISCGIP